jgi:hypothetical protein
MYRSPKKSRSRKSPKKSRSRRSPKKSRSRKSNVCKKLSKCACKGVRCMVKPYKCRGITKCSKGQKYNK